MKYSKQNMERAELSTVALLPTKDPIQENLQDMLLRSALFMASLSLKYNLKQLQS